MAAAKRHESTRRRSSWGSSPSRLALMLLISLATYNPADPVPFFKAGASGPGAQLHRAHRRLPGRAARPPALRRGRAAAAPRARHHGLEALLVPAHRRALHQGRRPLAAAALADRVPDPDLRRGDHRGRAGARGRRRRRAGGGDAHRQLQPHRRLHRGGHGAVRVADPGHPVLLRRLPGRASGVPGRALRRRCARPGPTSWRPGARRDAARGHQEAHPEGARGGRRARGERPARAQGDRRRRRRDVAGEGHGRAPAQKPLPFQLPTRGAASRRTTPRRWTSEATTATPPSARPRRRARAAPPAPGQRGDFVAAADLDPGRDQARRWDGQDAPVREGQDPAGQVGGVRGHGLGGGDPPGPGGHHLRVQARRRGQVLEDRRPGRRPRPGPGGGVDPHRPHQRPRHGGHRDPERGAGDDLPARDPGGRGLPASPPRG